MKRPTGESLAELELLTKPKTLGELLRHLFPLLIANSSSQPESNSCLSISQNTAQEGYF